MKLCSRHSTVAALMLLLISSVASAQDPSAQKFHVFIRGVETGTEEVTLFAAPDGWTLRGSGQLGPPLNLTTQSWEIRYDKAWTPLEATLNQADQTNRWTVHTTFNGTIAANDVAQNGQNERRNLTIPADSVVLPNLIFGSYEALAARMASVSPGAQIPAFIVPQN